MKEDTFDSNHHTADKKKSIKNHQRKEKRGR